MKTTADFHFNEIFMIFFKPKYFQSHVSFVKKSDRQSN